MLTVTHNVDVMEEYWGIFWPNTPLQDTVDAIVEDTRIRLDDDDHAPDGTSWDEWSDSYAATRGPGDKLLFSSGELRDSIEAQRRSGDYIVGSDLDYAQVHQFGSPDGRIPERQYVGVSNEVEQALGEQFEVSFDIGWGRISG